ncbi:DUF4145 domain-containing protein [Actinokineospora sp. HUAS TT18]|uniref:DUF4145 domain-containing protein n=1 Tax=Actinokineospora sp. HUAS TT18 TaxID=3447451 RepID=UPI003F52140D
MTDFPADRASYQCRHCGVHTHGEVAATEYYQEEPDYNGPLYRYRLARCSACDDWSLLLAMKLGVNYGQDVYEDDRSIYPQSPRSMSSAVPVELQKCFLEARSCFQARAYTATLIMCRRALELLTHERGAKQRDLAKSLEKLKELGHIDQRLLDWCTTLRLVGNRAAHDVDSDVTQVDAKDLIELAEAVIDYVYVFQARYEAFKARRAASTKPTTGAGESKPVTEHSGN